MLRAESFNLAIDDLLVPMDIARPSSTSISDTNSFSPSCSYCTAPVHPAVHTARRLFTQLFILHGAPVHPAVHTARHLFTQLFILHGACSPSCSYCTAPVHPAVHAARHLFTQLFILHGACSPSCSYCTAPVHPAVHTARHLFTQLFTLHGTCSPSCSYCTAPVHPAVHIARRLFTQLFILHGACSPSCSRCTARSESTSSLVYCLLPDKQRQTYYDVFGVLKRRLTIDDQELELRTVISDFESGTLSNLPSRGSRSTAIVNYYTVYILHQNPQAASDKREAAAKLAMDSTADKMLVTTNEQLLDKLGVLKFRIVHAMAKHDRTYTDNVWLCVTNVLDKHVGDRPTIQTCTITFL